MKFGRNRLSTCFLICVFLLCAYSLPGAADEFSKSIPARTTAGKLKPGPYAVGYRLMHVYDYSRTFRLKYNYDGSAAEGEIARPVQISLWYPVADSAGAPVKQYEYVNAQITETDFERDNSDGLENARRITAAFFGRQEVNQREIDAFLTSDALAIRDAEPPEGTFPLILYAPSINAAPDENTELIEFLASHGYIIASSPSIGMYSAAMTFDRSGFAASLRDLEFVLGEVLPMPNVDRRKTGAFGFSWGGLPVVLLAMGNSQIDAVASLDGSIGFQPHLNTAAEFLQFDQRNMTAAFMYMAGNDMDPEVRDLSFYDDLLYADAYLLKFKRMTHSDFSSRRHQLAPAVKGVNKRYLRRVRDDYETACTYLLNFFNAYLKGDGESMGYIRRKPRLMDIDDDTLEHTHKEGNPTPPTETQFFAILEKQGLEAGRNILKAAREVDPTVQIFSEQTMNRIGYRILNNGYIREAIALFLLNAEAYPDSWSVYDSLAEAYMKNGENDLARRHYTKSLEMNPENTNARDMLKRLR